MHQAGCDARLTGEVSPGVEICGLKSTLFLLKDVPLSGSDKNMDLLPLANSLVWTRCWNFGL